MWHYQIRNAQKDLLTANPRHPMPFRLESQRTPRTNNKYNSTANPSQTLRTLSADITTALQPARQIWYLLLLPIDYTHDTGKPGPPWPPPTQYSHGPLLVSHTTDTMTRTTQYPTATRPGQAWQPKLHHQHQYLHAYATSLHQNQFYYHQYLHRQPKYLPHSQQRANHITPTTADKNLLRPP